MARLTRYACLLVLLFPSVALAQTPTLAWDHPVSGERAERFELSVDGGKTWTANLGLPSPMVTPTVLTYAVPLPNVPSGSILAVRGCNTAGCSGPSNLLTIGNTEPPPPPPPCSDVSTLPTVFVTRWQHTTGRPGSRFRIDFQLGGSSPITEIQGRINGQTQQTITGTDLRGTAGIWMTAPAAGNHTVSVWVKASNSCTKEASALVNLVVK